MEFMLGGFITQVLPTAITADSLTAIMMTGRFHGIIRAATPKGSRLKYESLPSCMGILVPIRETAIAAL
jgi:hypothetical protein